MRAILSLPLLALIAASDPPSTSAAGDRPLPHTAPHKLLAQVEHPAGRSRMLVAVHGLAVRSASDAIRAPLTELLKPDGCRAPPPRSRRQRRALARARAKIWRERVNAGPKPLIFQCRACHDVPVAEKPCARPPPRRPQQQQHHQQRSPRTPELHRSPPRGISLKRNCRSAAQPARAGRSDRPARLAHEDSARTRMTGIVPTTAGRAK